MSHDRAVKLYIFDADGTLRYTTVPGQPCPNKPGEWALLPGVRERLARIDWGPNGAHFGVASNQGGVGMGYIKKETAYQLLAETAQAALGRPAPPGSIEMCTCAPYVNCDCRKPKPGMLLRLMHRFDAKRRETLFVGDMDKDEEAARRAGVRFMWAHDFFGWDAPPPGGSCEFKQTTADSEPSAPSNGDD